jgi:signal transduction histidine kinase
VAALLSSLSSLSLWLIKPADKTTWKKNKKQLFFNMGMSAISVFVAGFVLLAVKNLLADSKLLANTVPWLIGAIIYDQVNMWLLLGILRLQHGPEIALRTAWKNNTWAVSISIILLTVGGALLAFAIERFDWIGIIIFFLPIVLSAFAFRIYVRQMKEHMDNLEEIIANRTHELALAIEELEDLNGELKILNKDKDAFLAILAHDMKSPLTSISLYASLLKDRPQLAVERPHMATVILRSQETLLDIVNNILDLEKLQATGSISLEKEAFNLVSVVEGVGEIMGVQAAEKEISFVQKIHSPAIIINGDSKQIKRVFINLISNAIKYSPKGGAVLVSLEQVEATAIFKVADNGYGIPADELPHIFERYRRVNEHRNLAVGTGLGLAIVMALVEAHEGEIIVNSKEGEGSEFIVRLNCFVV